MTCRDSGVSFDREVRTALGLGCFCLFLLAQPKIVFSAAIVVNGSLNFNGNGVVVDSFDSSNPTLSTGGRYDPTKAGDNGDVYVGQGFTNVASIGNADIYGTLFTSLSVPISLGSAGMVGTHSWEDAGNIGIEPGFWVTTNFALTDIAIPTGPFLVPGPGSVATQTSPATNQTFLGQTNLPTLGPGQSISITTNTTTLTTNDYPGPLSGLVTNITITPPCITPITNTTCGGVWIESPTVPDSWCAANGIITNCTLFNRSPTLPSPGSLCPGSEIVTNAGHGYTYNLMTSYDYTTNIEIVTYSTNYDCPSTTNYTYSYPQFSSYDYTIYYLATYQTNNYDDVLAGGIYFATNLANIIVTGPSTLVLDASIFAIGGLTIAPGGSLTLYIQGSSCEIFPSSIANQSGLASNLQILCTPSVTILTIESPGSLSAVVDAPEANALLLGGGGAALDFSGTLLVNSLTAIGHVSMHYDEALGQLGYLLFPAAPTSPSLLPNLSANGLFQFYVQGTPGDNCAVETSTNLVNWVPVFTNVAPFNFTDTNGMGLSQNFYRTIYVQ